MDTLHFGTNAWNVSSTIFTDVLVMTAMTHCLMVPSAGVLVIFATMQCTQTMIFLGAISVGQSTVVACVHANAMGIHMRCACLHLDVNYGGSFLLSKSLTMELLLHRLLMSIFRMCRNLFTSLTLVVTSLLTLGLHTRTLRFMPMMHTLRISDCLSSKSSFLGRLRFSFAFPS